MADPEITQEDAMLRTARTNIRSFIGSASFRCEADREAALACVQVLEEQIDGLNDVAAVLRSAFNASEELRQAAIAQQIEKDAGIADKRAEYLKGNEMYPAYGLNSQAEACERIADAIRAQKP